MPRVRWSRWDNRGLVSKTNFAGWPGSYGVSVLPPKVGYWKYAKRAVRYLMSEHNLMDCPSDGQPKILELGHFPTFGELLFITFQVPRNGYTTDYEALVSLWPSREGADVISFRKIEGSEKLIGTSDTTTAGDDQRILSPPSSDDEGIGQVYRHRNAEDCGEDSDMESSEDSGEDNDEMPGMKHYFPNIPDRIHACPPESEYWSKAERAVDRLMEIPTDVMDFPPIGRPKILELGLRAKDNMVLYIAFQVPLKNGYTTDYEAIGFVSPVEECDICSFKKVKNSERPIKRSDTTGWSLVSDDRCTLSRLSPDDEGSTMGSGAGYGDESEDDGSMMCVDADDDLSKSGTGLLSKGGTYIEKGSSIMKDSGDSNIDEKVAFLGGATERLNIM